METDFILEDYQIDREKKELKLRICCRIPEQMTANTIRLSAVFRGKLCDRHYPVVAGRRERTSQMTQYDAQTVIQMEYLFFDEVPDDKETVTLQISYCNLEGQWVTSEPLLEFSGDLFQRERERKPSFPSALWGWCKYALCTVLLPIWLFDGWLAVKRGRELHPAAAGRAGKGALLYHAHGLVKDWTGHGYSIREYKTNYFKRCYNRACQRIPETKGILLLSERRIEEGGNLALVRGELDKKGCRYQQFLTTKPVHRLSRKELRSCATLIAGARLVILEDFFPQLHALTIREDTGILQLWHACGAFKLFGLSELGIVDHLEQSSANHRCYTAAITSSQEIIPFYSEAFGISQKRIRAAGVPRTDIFFDEEYGRMVREQLFGKYPVCKGKKVILFAPTFRGSGNKTAYYPMEQFPIDEIMGQLPEDTVLVIKHHPFVHGRIETEGKYRDRVLDLSEKENINDLLFITSLLITDYSSVIFEATLLKLPLLFYVFDLEEYLATRNFYFDFAGFAPGVIVQDRQSLPGAIIDVLDNADSCEREEKSGDAGDSFHGLQRQQAFRNLFLGALDGKSTDRTMSFIEELLR